MKMKINLNDLELDDIDKIVKIIKYRQNKNFENAEKRVNDMVKDDNHRKSND